MYEKVGNLIEEHVTQIQSAFLRFTDPSTDEFSVPLGDGCLVLVTRIKSFSPTFPEYFHLVEESRRIDVKVLVECPLHSITEVAGRLFESTRGSPLEVLTNPEMKEQIVTPMLSAVQTGSARNKTRNAAIISIFYSSGLRLNGIADLKGESIDYQTGTVSFDEKKEKSKTYPQTQNEIADVIGMNQKTVQMALMELVSTKPDVKWKKIGRYRLFWKEKPR